MIVRHRRMQRQSGPDRDLLADNQMRQKLALVARRNGPKLGHECGQESSAGMAFAVLMPIMPVNRVDRCSTSEGIADRIDRTPVERHGHAIRPTIVAARCVIPRQLVAIPEAKIAKRSTRQRRPIWTASGGKS